MGKDQIREGKVDSEKEEEEEEKMNKFYAIIRQFTQVRCQIQQSSYNHSNSSAALIRSPPEVLKFRALLDPEDHKEEEKLLTSGLGEINDKELPSWGPCFKWEDFRDCDMNTDINNKKKKKKPADCVGGNNKKRKVMVINNIADDHETSEKQCRTSTTGLDLNLAL